MEDGQLERLVYHDWGGAGWRAWLTPQWSIVCVGGHHTTAGGMGTQRIAGGRNSKVQLSRP